jgi:hypothetical protein
MAGSINFDHTQDLLDFIDISKIGLTFYWFPILFCNRILDLQHSAIGLFFLIHFLENLKKEYRIKSPTMADCFYNGLVLNWN